MDAQSEVMRGDMAVFPRDQKEALSTREWSYRAVVVALNNTVAELWIQALPIPRRVIKSSAWMDTEFIGGVAWHPRLPPGALHSGPAPYLFDRRTAAAKSADSLPSSQAYRDLALHLLMSARAPVELVVDNISQITVDRQEPTMGQFYASSESPPEQADVNLDPPQGPGATSPSPPKRPRTEPQSKFFFTTWECF